jgi:plastocyanin
MILAMLALPGILAAPIRSPSPAMPDQRRALPHEQAAAALTVTQKKSPLASGITILTEAVATKETGPKKTVGRFGEVYAFSPAFLAVHRDEPTTINFWNLQEDDEHDFMLVDDDFNVLMKVQLPPLESSSYVLTFHREGLFTFYCTLHQPEMRGQILVVPPRAP